MLKGFATKAYELLFLWLMKEGPLYGYELANRFEKMTGGHIKLSYGTVYPYLRRIESRGLISSAKDETSGRIYYELTPKGRLALEKLSGKLEEYQDYFNEKLLGFIAVYLELFGREALNKLLKQI